MSKCLKALGVFTLGAFGMMAQTMIPAPDTRTTGVIGIASGETARFNVLNDYMNASGPACAAVLNFYGGDGALLKTAAVTIAPGVAGYLDLFSSELNLGPDERRQIRATVAIPLVPVPAPAGSAAGTAPTTTPACHIVATLEILDATTGRTLSVLGGTHSTVSDATP